jgi:hypothetical protein
MVPDFDYLFFLFSDQETTFGIDFPGVFFFIFYFLDLSSNPIIPFLQLALSSVFFSFSSLLRWAPKVEI